MVPKRLSSFFYNGRISRLNTINLEIKKKKKGLIVVCVPVYFFRRSIRLTKPMRIAMMTAMMIPKSNVV